MSEFVETKLPMLQLFEKKSKKVKKKIGHRWPHFDFFASGKTGCLYYSVIGYAIIISCCLWCFHMMELMVIANSVNCGAKDPLSWFLCQCIGNLLVHLDLFVSFAFVLIVVIHLLGDLLAWCCTTGMVPFLPLVH